MYLINVLTKLGVRHQNNDLFFVDTNGACWYNAVNIQLSISSPASHCQTAIEYSTCLGVTLQVSCQVCGIKDQGNALNNWKYIYWCMLSLTLKASHVKMNRMRDTLPGIMQRCKLSTLLLLGTAVASFERKYATCSGLKLMIRMSMVSLFSIGKASHVVVY